MRDEDARFVFAEGERQPVKELMRAEPYIPVISHVNRRLKIIAVSPAHKAVRAVRPDYQVRAFNLFYVSYVSAEAHFNAEVAASVVKYVQEIQTRYARKAVAANGDLLAFMNDVNVVPGLTPVCDRGERFFVVVFEV